MSERRYRPDSRGGGSGTSPDLEGFNPIIAWNFTPEEAAQRTELIRLWEELDAFLRLTPNSALGSPTVGDDPEVSAARARFAALFKEEIDIVRAARDYAAHSRPIDAEILREAVQVGRELVRIAREGQAIFTNRRPHSESGS